MDISTGADPMIPPASQTPPPPPVQLSAADAQRQKTNTALQSILSAAQIIIKGVSKVIEEILSSILQR